MDLVYIPDMFSYGYARNPQYRDYEMPWNRDYFKCSSRKSLEKKRPVQPVYKENCNLCKEIKRRNLAAYIRTKSRSDSYSEGIHEEEEENDMTCNAKKVADINEDKLAKSSTGADKL